MKESWKERREVLVRLQIFLKAGNTEYAHFYLQGKLIKYSGLGVMVNTYNLSYLDGRDLGGSQLKANLGKKFVRTHFI
jgi:hypothetical protein